MQSTRVKRKCAQKYNTKKPSAIHYLGYVDDEEPIEMIMKKFETMDKLIGDKQKIESELKPESEEEAAANGSNGHVKDEPLDEALLETVFKETSHFSVEMLANETINTAEYLDPDPWAVIDPYEFYIHDSEEEFWGDDSIWDDNWDEDLESNKRRRFGTSGIGGNQHNLRTKAKLIEITGTDGYVYTVKKRIRYVDPLMPTYTRIPPEPMPYPWARTFEPFHTKPITSGFKYIESDILKMDFKLLTKQSKFQAVLIDPPWKLPGTNGYMTPSQLAKLDLPALVDDGFIMIWVEKEILSSVVKVMTKHNFTYVENLVWVKQAVNNTLETQPYLYFRKSKTSLLLFRKGGTLELRHQRNPDVIFDFSRNDKGNGHEDKPDLVYHTIETLLPETKYSEGKPLKLLELWAKKDRKRLGWITVCHNGDQ